MIFQKSVLVLGLLMGASVAWADPLTVDLLDPSPEAAPYLSVLNQNNTTGVYVKTYSGKEILVWQQTPEFDLNNTLMSFNADRAGDFLGFQYSKGNNQTGVITHTVVVDLKNNLASSPSTTLEAYSSEGIGIYEDAKKPNVLLAKPIFQACSHPTEIPIRKDCNGVGECGPAPRFIDNTHLHIDYIDGVVVAQSDIAISLQAILERCSTP